MASECQESQEDELTALEAIYAEDFVRGEHHSGPHTVVLRA